MDDLTRLVGFLVSRIEAESPDRLHTAFQVSEVYQRFIPYRRFKADLGFDTIDDYDAALLRFFAGEKGLATLAPGDAQIQLAAELEAVNPNPGLFREFAAARVRLSADAVQEVLGHQAIYQPPAPRQEPPSAEPAPEVQPEPEPVPEPVIAPRDHLPAVANPATAEMLSPSPFESLVDTPSCQHCHGELPRERTANFCPHCGSVLGSKRCQECGDLIEDDWSFCLCCGKPLRR